MQAIPDIDEGRNSVTNGAKTPVRSDTTSSTGASGSSFSSPMMQAAVGAGLLDGELGQSMLGLSLDDASLAERERTFSTSPPPLTQAGAPTLTAPLPTISSLEDVASAAQSPNTNSEAKVKWIRDVLFLVNRSCTPPAGGSATDTQLGAINIDDPTLQNLAYSAVELLLSLIPAVPPSGTKLSPPLAEALYLRATLTSSGTFPAQIAQNPRAAFRAFEAAARSGHSRAWFNIGRDYEAFGESKRAKDCFERGAKADDVSCLYRLGMANLMGQLGLPVASDNAVGLLYRAAERASIFVPQPAYVYASLLFGDFAHTAASIPLETFQPCIPAGSTVYQEAQRFLERSAYLHFAPAQYKLGHFYEFAREPYAYDPLLSVQYYTLASSSGEAEADMALSKWMLCGAEGAFEKDEALAYTFAERAARTGLPSAEFALGYYWEVGIGTSKDMRRAKRWYEKASAHGNKDASDRLSSLAQEASHTLSREDHDNLAEKTLVRRRTQAKQRSDAAGSIRRTGPREDAVEVVEIVRRVSKIRPRNMGPSAALASARSSLSSERIPESTRSERSSLQDESQHRRHAETMPTPALAPPLFPEKKRFSLADPGPTSRSPSPLRPDSRSGSGAQSPPRRYASPSPARTGLSGSDAASTAQSTGTALSDSPMSSPPPDAVPSGAAAAASGPRVRYNTFAEMGIEVKGPKEEKDCVIM